MPFPTLRRLVQWLARRPSREPDPGRPHGGSDYPARVSRRVRRLARFVPAATCLTQALGVYILLTRAGYRPQLQVGVARDARGQFAAHAWVELERRVIIGGSVRHYRPLFVLEEERA